MRPTALAPLFLRQFALALTVLAVLVQAAIPAGYMAAPSDGAFPFAVVLCGDSGSAVAADLGGGQHDENAPADQDGAKHPCVFAGFGAGVIAPDLPALAAAPVAYRTAEFAPAPVRAAISIGANSPPPSRAPPAFI